MAIADRLFLARYRATVADGLRGRILDIGAGTGAMFPYYATNGAVEAVIALEPDQAMRRRGRRRGRSRTFPVHWVTGVGESLPLGDNSVDAIVCSVVLCTVEDPTAVIAEMSRVLRPDGELRVLEHVAANGLQGRFQRVISPGWQRMAGGCHPDRPTDRLLERHPRFEPIETRRIRIGLPPIRPFHLGRYRPS